jgi:hypothetical protein
MIIRPTILLTVTIQEAVGKVIPRRLSTNEHISQNRYYWEESRVAENWQKVFRIPAKITAEPVVPPQINLLDNYNTADKPNQAENVNDIKNKPKHAASKSKKLTNIDRQNCS